MKLSSVLENFTHRFAKWAGSSGGFVLALITVLIWLVCGWYYHFSSNWETSFSVYIGIVTFLMVFLIQRGQIKENMAIQAKLNELIVASQAANNQLINLEELSEKEISDVKHMHQDIAIESPDDEI